MSFQLLTTWEQVQTEIIAKYINNKNGGSKEVLDAKSKKHLFFDINNKMKHHLYDHLDKQSIINTIKYTYWETRAGVFVSIRNNKLEAFIPFANDRYRNDWYKELTFYGVPANSKFPVRDYLERKRKELGNARRMGFNPSLWWANHHFLNVEARPDVWGTHSLPEYREMIQEALKQHTVSNCMFVINKRDHPILRKDLAKPYTFLYKGSVPKINTIAASYAPIITSYSNDDYLDIVIPIVQDWILASNPNDYYPILNDVAWKDKTETAFFRGAATGRINNNQRITLAKISYDWSLIESKSNLLDAGLTSWNLSDKVDDKGFVQYNIPRKWETVGVCLKNKMPMDLQVEYKYILNVDGHTRPNRTSWLLQCGSLMLMVEPQNSDRTWIDKVLKPWKHYVPVSKDLTDLEEKILWCKKNDDECKKIVKQAKAFCKTYFTKDVIAEYMAYLMNRIAQNKR